MSVPFQPLIHALQARAVFTYEIDKPRDPKGEWWLDLTIDGRETSVTCRPGQGFGLYTATDEPAFGARPDEIIVDPDAAADRIIEIVSAL